ncbi:hypothetical protein ACWEWU_09500 [Staphylococcus xylosus]
MAEYKVKASVEASVKRFRNQISSAIRTVEKYKRISENTKDVKLKADASNVKKTVKKAKATVESYSKTKGEAKLDIDSSKLKTQINNAKSIVDGFDNLKADAQLSADIKRAKTNIRELESYIKKIDNENPEVNVDADIEKAKKRINILQTNLASLVNKEYSAEIGANAKKAREAIKRAKSELNNFAKQRAKAKIDVDIKAAGTRIDKFKAMLRSIPNRIKTKMEIDNKSTSVIKRIEGQINKFKGDIDRLAGDIKSFSIVFSQTFKGIMLTSIQGLIPIIAGLVPALFAVLNAVKALTGGVLAFAGAGAIAFGGFAAYAGMAITAIQMLEDGTIQANSATEKYQSALEAVKDTWQDIVKQNANAIFESMANGLNTVKSALISLTPFFKGVADGINNGSKKMLEWAQNSKVAQNFFKMMNTTGVSVFNKLLSALGRFGDAFINVFTQLAPLFQWSANWLDRLGESFQKWANSASGQNSIKQFIEYTKNNLPIIGNIFKNVFAGIFNLMRAFGENSTSIFKYLETMSAKFRKWSETVGNSQGFKKFIEYMQENGPVIMQLIGNIVRLLVAFGTAMAPIASAILSVVTKIIGFTAALMENHPWIARVVGMAFILLGAIWSLAVPLIAINSFLGLFGTSLLKLVKSFVTSGNASKIFTGLINILKGVLGFLLNPIGNIVKLLPLLGTAFTVLTGPIGIVIGIIAGLVGAIVYLWKTNEDFRNFITEAWQGLTETIGSAIQGIISWFQELWSNIQSTLQPIMPILEVLGEIFNKIFGIQIMLIISQVITAFQGLWTVIQVVFQLIGASVSMAVNTIISLFTALIQLFTGDFSGALETLKNMVSTNLQIIWQTIQNIFGIITGFLSSTLNRILGIFGTSWQKIWSIVSTKATQIWTTITTIFGALVGIIAGFVGRWVARITTGFSQMVSQVVSGMARFLARIIAGFVRVVSAVGQGVSNAVSKVRSFVSDFVQAGVDLIAGMIRGVIDKAKDLAKAAWDAAKGALNAAKRALGIKSPSREFKSLGMYSMIGLANGIKQNMGGVIDNVTRVSDAMTKAFKPTLNVPNFNQISSNLKNLDFNINAQVQHTHTNDFKPNEKIVRVEVNVNNDALLALINGENAKRNATYYM